MAAHAAHFSYTCCIFSSIDFQCVCKLSIVCISTNKPTASESSSSLHTSKILLQNDCPCKHSQEGTKNVRQLPHQSSTGKVPFPAQSFGNISPGEEVCFARDIFASLYPAEDFHWLRQPIWKIQLHCPIKLWTKVWNTSLYLSFTGDY